MHIAVTMTLDDVISVEGVVFVGINIVDSVDLEILIALPAATLGTVWAKGIYRDATRNTGLALCALGAIKMTATATKTELRKLTVKFDIHWRLGIHE